VGKKTFKSSCDIAKSALAKAGVPYKSEFATAGTLAVVRIGSGTNAMSVESFNGNALAAAEFKSSSEAFIAKLKSELKTAGYPAKANMDAINFPMLIALCAYLVILVTMVYGPIAAWLVELFPTRIRYTSMSLPYHIGNGWFGGLLPVTSFAIVAATGDIYNGLWYPIVVATVTAIIGTFFLRETHGEALK
jgi:hypothetical protein